MDKAEAIFNHFSSQLGQPTPRDASLNWEELQLQSHDLTHLEEEFTEDEMQAVISEIAAYKAPGPVGTLGCP